MSFGALSEEQGYKRYVEDTKTTFEIGNSFQTIENWVLRENSFIQLLLTCSVVITEKGTN